MTTTKGKTMTETPSFHEQRVAVLQSQLQLSLVEIAEREAIIERAEQQIVELQKRGAIKPHDSILVRRTLHDSNGATLKLRDAQLRKQHFIEAAELVASIVDDDLLRADNDCADAARNAFDRALNDMHGKLLVVAKLADA